MDDTIFSHNYIVFGCTLLHCTILVTLNCTSFHFAVFVALDCVFIALQCVYFMCFTALQCTSCVCGWLNFTVSHTVLHVLLYCVVGRLIEQAGGGIWDQSRPSFLFTQKPFSSIPLLLVIIHIFINLLEIDFCLTIPAYASKFAAEGLDEARSIK